MARHVEFRFFEEQCLVIRSPRHPEETLTLHRRNQNATQKRASLVRSTGVPLRILERLTSRDEPFHKDQLFTAAKYTSQGDAGNNLVKAISSLKVALGDSSSGEIFIENIRGFG